MIQTTIDSTQIDRLARAVGVYSVASRKTLGYAVTKAAKELSWQLHRETAKETPSKEELLGLGEKLGWRIRRRPGKTAKQELRRRVARRKYSASGWLPAVRAFIRDGGYRSNGTPQGFAQGRIDAASGEAVIRLVNRTAVIEQLTRSRGILQRAVSGVVANMAPYIRRKLGEDAERSFRQI